MGNINYLVFKKHPKDEEIFEVASEIIQHPRFKEFEPRLSNSDGEVFTLFIRP